MGNTGVETGAGAPERLLFAAVPDWQHDQLEQRPDVDPQVETCQRCCKFRLTWPVCLVLYIQVTASFYDVKDDNIASDALSRCQSLSEESGRSV